MKLKKIKSEEMKEYRRIEYEELPEFRFPKVCCGLCKLHKIK